MQYLSAYRTIKQTTIIPLLFRIFDDYEANVKDHRTICNVLSYLLTYLVRMNASEINKNMGKFMKSLYARAIGDDYENYYEKFVKFLNDVRSNDHMPTDKEFREALINKPLYKRISANTYFQLLRILRKST